MSDKMSRKRSQAARRGWETRRRNAAVAADHGETAPDAKAASKTRKPLRASPVLLARLSRPRGKPRTNPFSLPQFPPGATPESGQRMAMDDATGWAQSGWQAAAISGIFAEGLAFPGYPFLAELAQRPEYRRFAEILATEMTRKWIRLQSVGDDDKSDKIKELNDAIDEFKLRDVFRRCIELDELFGRSHLYVDTGATDDREELKTSIGTGRDEVSRAKIAEGSLIAFRPVEPVWVYPINYDAADPLKPDWYEPVTWFVMGKEVHKTRLLKFVGREVPDLLKPAYSFGGLSMTQMSKAYVDNWLRTRQSIADLINAFSVFVLKTDLQTSLMDDGNELFERAELFNRLRDNRGLMMLDKETEEFQNVAASIAGLEGLQAQVQEHLCAVAAIPVVKYLGVQPTGLNASDEGGIRMFYDWINASQEKRVRPQLTSAIDIIQLSLWGKVDQEITFVFEPLWSLDEKAEAEKREVEARTDVSLIDAGVLSPEEVRQRIAADPDSPHASIDVEDMPDLKQEEEAGLDPKAGGGERGIGKPPHDPSDNQNANENGGDEGEDDEPEELSPFQQRVAARQERARDYLDPDYLEKRRQKRLGEEDQDVLDDEDAPIESAAPLSFKERVAARGERHARKEGDFYDRAREREERNRRGETPFHARARERSARGRNFLKDRIADRQAEEEEPADELSADAKFDESKVKRDKGGKFATKAERGGGKADTGKKKPETKSETKSKPASVQPKNPPGKGTEAERNEIRKKMRAEKDITGEGAKKLRQELINSYYVSLEKARKAGNKERTKEFEDRLLSFGEPRSKVTGQASKQKSSVSTARKISVTHTGPSSSEYRQMIDSHLGRLSPKVKNILSGAGTHVITARDSVVEALPHLKDSRPRGWAPGMTWENVPGVHDPDIGRIVVSEYYKDPYSGAWTKNTRADRTLHHELGHAFDRARFKLSHGQEFIDAYKQDVDALDPAHHSEVGRALLGLGYFLQPGAAGREEAFAELFANAHGFNSAAGRIDAHFPRCYAIVKRETGK